MENSVQNLKVKSGMKLYEQVLFRIHDLIAQGVYRKGDMLPSEKTLIEMMGVSRITVREALRLLSEAGVIETKKGKGSFVRIDAEELQMYMEKGEDYRASFLLATDARLMLEPAVAATIAKEVDQNTIEQLAQCFEKGKTPAVFHSTLIAALNNPVVSHWFAETVELEAGPMMNRMIPPAKQKSTVCKLEEQHRKIFTAIRERNEMQAYLLMKEHLEYVRSIYSEYFNTFFR